VVSGVVVGNVAAEDSVTLNPGSKLVGDINAPRVIVSDGAAFSGNVAMNGEAPPRARPRVAARARPAARSGSVRSDTTSAGIRPAVAETTAPKIRREAPPAVTRTPAVATPEPSRAEEESTVVVRHAAIGRGDTGGAPAPKKAPPKPTNKAAKKATASGKTGKKKTKKKTPRARVPKPGKRRVTRR
jgi:hypothetical protein